MNARLLSFNLVMLAAFAAVPSAASADTTQAQTARPTQLSAGSGAVLYSAYDASTGSYRLMRLVDGRANALPVAPSARDFQADVGPTDKGDPFYVYVRCGEDPDSCDLFAYNPRTGIEQRSKASDPSHSESLPTYWRGRLAFVRDYGTAAAPKQIVYQRPNPNTRRSQRLPGLPDRRCEDGECIDPAGRFTALELFGDKLAQTATSDEFEVYRPSSGRPEILRSAGVELRLVDRGLRRSRRLFRSGRGEGGQSLTGLGFATKYLYASFTCLGDPDGCGGGRAAGLYRFDYSDGSFAFSPENRATYGLAVYRTSTYELTDAPGGECDQVAFGPADAPRCALVRRTPAPTFKAIPAP